MMNVISVVMFQDMTVTHDVQDEGHVCCNVLQTDKSTWDSQ